MLNASFTGRTTDIEGEEEEDSQKVIPYVVYNITNTLAERRYRLNFCGGEKWGGNKILWSSEDILYCNIYDFDWG